MIVRLSQHCGESGYTQLLGIVTDLLQWRLSLYAVFWMFFLLVHVITNLFKNNANNVFYVTSLTSRIFAYCTVIVT